TASITSTPSTNETPRAASLHVPAKPKRRAHGDTQAVATLGQKVVEEIDVNIIESHADADMPGGVDIEAPACPEERLQVALLPAWRQQGNQGRSKRSVGLQSCRLMQAADGGTHKERHPLELSEIELRSGGESIGCRIEGHGDRYARRHQACQLLLKRRGQVL